MTQGMGLQIMHRGHEIRLKWHRLRRSMGDPEFGAAVMAEGFRLGASMELDLQVRGDGGFVVLHDETLDRETTGHGAVSSRTRAEIAALRYRQQDCAPILSEDLAQMPGAAHPEALLQFDMKNNAAEVGALGIAHFATHFAQHSGLIVSGGSIPLIRSLAECLPNLKRGYDPTDDLSTLSPDLAAMERHLTAVLRDDVKPDMVYLQWEMVVEAAAQGLDMVALAHADGVRVDVWTHRMADPAKGFTDAEWNAFSALLALSPDQITTDEPLATESAYLRRTLA